MSEAKNENDSQGIQSMECNVSRIILVPVRAGQHIVLSIVLSQPRLPRPVRTLNRRVYVTPPAAPSVVPRCNSSSS